MAKSADRGTQAKALVTTAPTEAMPQTIVYHLAKAPTALAAFDVDMRLTVPQHPACHYPNMKRHHTVLNKLSGPFSEVEEDETLTLATRAPEQQLAEANTSAAIKPLQQQSITRIVFTTSLTGAPGGSVNLQERRFQDLQALEGELVTKAQYS